MSNMMCSACHKIGEPYKQPSCEKPECPAKGFARMLGTMLDLNDLIRHPERYLVDGKPLLSAALEMKTLDGSVFIHRYDHRLQEKRVSLAGSTGTAGVQEN